jgi:hypothetical protein
MFFQGGPQEGVTKSPKNDKYTETVISAMHNSSSTNGLSRLDTGERCDVPGCREMALWVVSYKSQTSHWCIKHTRTFMRDASINTKETESARRPPVNSNITYYQEK